jgi:chromosome segregation ATPase
MTKNKSDFSYAAGAHSTLQDFVASVLVRFESLRERTEAALASMAEESLDKSKRNVPEFARDPRLSEEKLAEICASLTAQQQVQQDLKQQVSDLRDQITAGQRPLQLECGDLELSRHMDREQNQLASLRHDLHTVRVGLMTSGSTGAAGSGGDSEAVMERVEDVLGVLGGLCERIGNLETTWTQSMAQALLEIRADRKKGDDSVPQDLMSPRTESDITPRRLRGKPRIRASLVEAALSHEGESLSDHKQRLDVMREALTPRSQPRSPERSISG